MSEGQGMDANDVGDPIERKREGWGRNIGYDGPEDVRRPRDLDPVPGSGTDLSQFEQARRQAEAAELREHRHAHRVAAAEHRIAKRLNGRTVPPQEQGYQHGYGR